MKEEEWISENKKEILKNIAIEQNFQRNGRKYIVIGSLGPNTKKKK